MTTIAPKNNGTILIIDDLPENLQLLSELLMQLDYTVRTVTSGRLALLTLELKKPDLILLDIKMPDMDGYQVCDAIKANEEFRDIPIIFISALDEAFDKVRAFSSGGVDYITKPFEIEEVLARVENQLTIQRQKISLQKEIKKRRETEEVLYQSRALLASVLNTSPDGIAALQAVRHPETGAIEDFRCLVVNPIVAHAFNLSCEEIIDNVEFKNIAQRINPGFLERVIKVVETGEPMEEDFYYPLDGLSWYHLVAVKLGDGFAITVRDITARKNMELELQLLARIDGLTKIANRRRFDEFLDKEWQRLQRSQQALSLLMLDVDYFKLYNDTYGHQQGDDCLKAIAKALQITVSRPSDLVARYGGEEFVIVLPETRQAEAIIVAEAISRAISDLAMPHKASKVAPSVTVSIGVVSLIPRSDHSPDYLTEQADTALYQAKNRGRNCYQTPDLPK